MFDDEAGENYVGSPKMAQIRRRLKVAKVDFSQHVFQEHPMAADLVMRMLAYSEQHRPTASACLEHPFFTEALDERAGSKENKMKATASEDWPEPSRGFEELIDD